MPARAAILAIVAGLLAAAPAQAAPDPMRGAQWNLDTVESDAAHATANGAGAIVAVIDSGVHAAHPDLAGRLLPGRDFVQNDDTPQDGDGHGTHVTGVVVANKENGVGISSVAPGATVLPLRVLGDDGSGSTENVAKAIDYAVAKGAQIINLSLGSEVPLIGAVEDDDDPFNAALGRAAAANVTIVAAAGNNSVPICEQPSVAGRLLCVGAVDRRGMRSFYSSSAGPRGVMAPGGSAVPVTGEDVLSTWNDGKYEEVAGTSQASPHVAGVAALLVSLGMRGQAVADRILATATDAGPSGPDDMYGAGILNARAAVAGLKPPGGGGVTGKASVAGTQRIKSVLKKGIRVSCRAAADGRCTARIIAGSTTLAYGSAKAKSGQTVSLIARVTKAGKKRLTAAKKNISARAEMAIPGAPTRTKSLTLKR